ncbi:MAG: 16S rRNA (guanine(527)-N(7))-methyltransferase RsmG [Kangiellaceae bacterium]|jgi:16S rRNA (guanine527-N7)-methyltransferase|nr:16S rRNA (guanine(527)-N(7))-methyltransferase RsmG [Kangiellaceae bacterium]
MNLESLISTNIAQLPVKVSSQQLAQFVSIIERLEKWNKAYNLTAIRNVADMVTLHLFDSLVIAPYLAPGRVLDVGTGPGFPGIPLAILLPNRSFYLLDSNGKKTRYMKQLVHEMGLSNVTVVDSRVEQWQPDQPFDVIVSRAFASLDKMVKLTDHLLSSTGCWQAMKGTRSDNEQQLLPSGISVESIEALDVPGLNAERHLITLKKQQ